MSDRFDNLRYATRLCIEQLGASRSEELFEFRNAATFTVVHELLREYDRLSKEAEVPVASHSLGELTAAEAALLQTFRDADERGKTCMQIAADVTRQMAEHQASQVRCEVVDIASALPPKK